MKIIDTHLHLFPTPDVKSEMNITQFDVPEMLDTLSKKLDENKINRGLLYVLDDNFTTNNHEIPHNLKCGCTINELTYKEDLKNLNFNNIKIIKILPYEDNITRPVYPQFLKIARESKKYNMVLTICATYGSNLVFDTNGVELAAYIKKHVNIPIILAHGGGPKIFEVMSLMLDYDDIFMDLSFSLNYWKNSSVIQDYAFALKKLGCERIFYGSDYPYVGFKESLSTFTQFLKDYNFTYSDKKKILYENFEKFEKKYL